MATAQIASIPAAQTLRTDYPSGVGLSPVSPTATASANAAALIAQAAYVAATWGSGRIVLPAGATIPCGPLGAWPQKVQLYSLQGTTLDFSSLTGTQTAMSLSGIGFTPIAGVLVKGPGKTSTVTGLDIAGQDLTFDHVTVREFGTCVDLANENTYINKFTGGAIGEGGLCVNLNLFDAGTSNAGERNVFTGVTFFNSTKILSLSTGGGSTIFQDCSFDYSANFGDLYGGHAHFSGCHFESADSATSSGYLFNSQFNPVITFEGCRFILAKFGAGGLRWILNPNTGPSNYGFGRITFGPGNRAYFFDTAGNGHNVSSDELIFIGAGLTTATMETPFVHKWGPITATPAWNDGTGVQAITVAPSASVSAGTVTVTASSAPATNALPVRVQF